MTTHVQFPHGPARAAGRQEGHSFQSRGIMSRQLRGLRGALLLAAVAALSLSLSGCGGYEAAKEKPAPEPAEEAPPPPKPIRLAELSPVTLDPGQRAAVAFEVERNGNEGAIQVAIEKLPDGMAAEPVEIPAGESTGRLELAASEKLGDAEFKATLNVTAKVGDLEAEQPLQFTVNKVNLPSFQPVDEIILQPGATKVVDLAITRDEFQGPLELRVEELPEQLTAKVANVAADASAAKLDITAAAGAPEGAKEFRVAGTLYGRTVDVTVPVRIDNRPYQVKSFLVVTLKPGETKRVEIPVERRSYKGPLDLEVDGLPEGVTVPKAQLAADQTNAALEFAAAPTAKEGVRSAKVISTGGELTRTDPVIVRVSLGESGFLPKEIAPDPDSPVLLRRGSFGGRLTPESKEALTNAYGGTPESEEAVLRGLRWLAAHQERDGRWSLQSYGASLPDCDCHVAAENEVVDYDTAGTAFGVLPFLGAGVTHSGGPVKPIELAEYRKRVYAAVDFLTKHQVQSDDPKKAGDLGGNMYSHAVATIALCEVYGLSGDERLKVPAQLAVKYLAESQHKEGGWRYSPGQAGDMSATAWVFLAIRSAQLAGLPIGRSSLMRVERFVNDCAVGPEEAKLSRYAYQPPTPEKAQPAKLSLSAAGLLTRQYLGWPKDNPDLLAGCRYLAGNLPPESGNQLGQIYYYHYATQVLHHMEGPDFDLWNHRMREHLLRTQEKEGHRAGSWSPEGTDWGSRGGRIYSTAMALLTLQVYYRHLPMYRPVKRTAD